MVTSRMCSLGMSDDDSDRGESLMRVVHPPTLHPLEPSMLHFWDME